MNVSYELEKLSDLIDRYDVFFIDLWGVVHNGFELLPNVLNVLTNLKNEKKKIFFLTNAPRRSFIIKDQLGQLGLDKGLYDYIITSGEITWQKLKEKENKDFKNCFLIAPERDFHLIEGLRFKIVDDTQLVDVIVNTGPWGDDDTIENYKLTLEELVKNDPLMICSNPDKVVVRGEKFMICAGLLAEYYQKIGGRVEYYGKPYDEIYNFCFERIRKKKRILVIGDSLENDIRGANNQNLDSLLITSGIHREVNIENGIDIKKLDDLMEKKSLSPTYFMRNLIY